ncbi:MAG: hypothetical protein ACI8VT_004203 [Saprospiraceae bacterium]
MIVFLGRGALNVMTIARKAQSIKGDRSEASSQGVADHHLTSDRRSITWA